MNYQNSNFCNLIYESINYDYIFIFLTLYSYSIHIRYETLYKKKNDHSLKSIDFQII